MYSTEGTFAAMVPGSEMFTTLPCEVEPDERRPSSERV